MGLWGTRKPLIAICSLECFLICVNTDNITIMHVVWMCVCVCASQELVLRLQTESEPSSCGTWYTSSPLNTHKHSNMLSHPKSFHQNLKYKKNVTWKTAGKAKFYQCEFLFLALSFILLASVCPFPISLLLYFTQSHTNAPWTVSDGHLRHWQISIQHVTLLTQHMSVLSALPSMLWAGKGDKGSSVHTGNKHMKHASRDYTSHSEICKEVNVNNKTPLQIKRERQLSISYLYD